VSTLVCLHAHPDDEAIATAGLMAKASADGHRVVLVIATNGEHGLEPADGLDPGETLAERRMAETHASAALLGVHRVEFLGYCDSGMDGDEANHEPGSFWQADVEAASAALAELLTAEVADVLTVYDPHGGYGHPDHIQVHRVGTRAAEIAGVEAVYWATMNRDAIRKQMIENAELLESPDDVESTDGPVDPESFGTPEAEITHAIAVGPWIEAKREAMRAHGSQITEETFFLQLPQDMFEQVFGTEWFVAPGTSRTGPFETSLFT